MGNLIYIGIALTIFFIVMYVNIKYWNYAEDDSDAQVWQAILTGVFSALWPILLPIGLFVSSIYYAIKFMKSYIKPKGKL